MGIRDLAAKAREKLTGTHSSAADSEAVAEQTVDSMGDRYDNFTGDRFTEGTDRSQRAVNERIDDFTGGEPSSRNRGPDL